MDPRADKTNDPREQLPSVLVTSGARPAIYGAYRVLVDPGDRVVYPVPSWNNDHYAYLVGAKAIEVPTRTRAVQAT